MRTTRSITGWWWYGTGPAPASPGLALPKGRLTLSLRILNTNFGDLAAQKIYWLSIGIVPWYEVFAGVGEVPAGTLLFFRRTTTLGAILLFGALGNIVYVNWAYDGGVHVYSSCFVLLT